MTEFYLFTTLLIYSLSFLGTLCYDLKLNVADKILKTTGDSQAVTCFGVNSDRLVWRKGSQDIKLSDRVTIRVINGTQVLLFNSISSSDAGNYSCHDIKNKKTVKFELKVRDPIKFKGTEDAITGAEGEEYLIVPCEAVGPRRPTIRWSYPADFSSRNESGKFREAGDGLYIHNVTADDAGIYTCRALIEELGEVISKNIQIYVTHKPRPKWDGTLGTRVIYIDDRTTANLSCLATAYPEPTVRWFLDGKDIPNWPISYYLEAVSPGNYQCIVSNEFGSVSRNFTVKEGKRPEPPTKLKAHNVTRNSIFLSSKTPKVEAEHRITGYVLEIRERQGRFNKTLLFPNGPPFSIVGLKEDTTYLVRLKAVNHMGHGDYSTEIEASTTAAAASTLQSLLLSYTLSLAVLFCSL